MEKQKAQLEKQQRHMQMEIALSRLAMDMAKNFMPGHDIEQSMEYYRLNEAYRQKEADKIEMDRFEPPEYKNHRILG